MNWRRFVAENKRLITILGTITVYVPTYLVIDRYVGGVRKVIGPSMRPTLNEHIYNFDYERQKGAGVSAHTLFNVVY